MGIGSLERCDDEVENPLIDRIVHLDDNDGVLVALGDGRGDRRECSRCKGGDDEELGRAHDARIRERTHCDSFHAPSRGTLVAMSTILLVADSRSVRDRVHTALAGANVVIIDHENPRTAAATAYDLDVDVVVVDMQVGSMGAMAVSRAVRAEARNREAIPVTILLDRTADSFLAKRAGANNWVSKDQSPTELRRAVGAAS